jgi:hypothetical protein
VTIHRVLGRVLAIAVVASAATGCHHSDGGDPYTVDRVAKLKPMLHYKSVVIHPFTVAKTVDDPANAPTDCHDAAVSYLLEKQLFDAVAGDASPGQPGQLIIDANVEDLRIVGGAARFWGGALAGRSHMTVKVVARDAATGQMVMSRLVESDNNPYGAAWSYGASDRGLPTNMGPVVADIVINAAQLAAPAAPPAPPPAQ